MMVRKANGKPEPAPVLANPSPDEGRILSEVILSGDLHSLSEEDRTRYYLSVCQATGLDPITRPFAYLELGDDKGGKKLILYATKDATDQLRRLHRISVQIVARERMDDVYVVTARASTPDGRTDESIGAVPLVREDGEWKQAQSGKRYFAPNGKLIPLRPDALANAVMKAETKAKRRATLSVCGMGMLDETEIETIPHATVVGQAAPPPGKPPEALPAPPAKEPPPPDPTPTPPPATKAAKLSKPALERIRGMLRDLEGKLVPNATSHLTEMFDARLVDDIEPTHYGRILTLLVECSEPRLTADTIERMSFLLEEADANVQAFCQHFGCSPDLHDFPPAKLLEAGAMLQRKVRTRRARERDGR